MKTQVKLPATILLLTMPLAAYAQEGAPHILLYSFGGGLAGGFFGALLACWLCKRFGSKNDSDSKRR
jgi:NhaP-type Na+/H+ or K+/H+ antiporter